MDTSKFDNSHMLALIRDNVLARNPLICPFPRNQLRVVNKTLPSIAPTTYADVKTETLTSRQKQYIADILEYVADLCLERVLQLTKDTPESLIERRMEFLRTVKRDPNG
jgi:hypothetical protein